MGGRERQSAKGKDVEKERRMVLGQCGVFGLEGGSGAPWP